MDYSLSFRAVVALLSHFCRTCKRYHKQDSSVVQTVSRDSQQRNQRFQRFYTYRGNATVKHSSPAGRGGARNRSPCPAGYMGDTLPHAVRVGIIRTKQKGVFMHPTPSFCQKMTYPPCQNRKNFFNFKKSHSSSLEVCYTYRKKGGIKNGQSRYCSHACGFCA